MAYPRERGRGNLPYARAGVARVYGQIEAKRRARRHLRCRPLLVEQVSEVVSSQVQEQKQGGGS